MKCEDRIYIIEKDNEDKPQIKAAEYLRTLIYQHYSSQSAFAKDIGIEQRTLSRYLSQGINSVEVLEKFAAFFNVDIAEFFW